MGESVACVMKEINQSRVLVRKSEGKRPHGRHRCGRWKIDIKTNVKKKEWHIVCWICLVHDMDK